MPATYTVSVGAFKGPFDLLLQLIARRKVDIYDIPLAEITDDYLAVLRQMDAVDLDTTTDFLVVAATLVELKAARLLPVDDDDDLDELALEARDLLYARLIDYRTFKHASDWIRKRMAAFSAFAPRTAGPDPQFRHLRSPLTFTSTPDELARLAAQARAGQPEPIVDVSHVQPVRMTVREAADLVIEELERAAGRATFRELTAGCRHRVEVITCFLALLELYKVEQIELSQAESFGELIVEVIDPGPLGAHGLSDGEEEAAAPVAEIDRAARPDAVAVAPHV